MRLTWKTYLNVGNVVAGVADRLNVDGLGLAVNGLGEVLWAVTLDELFRDNEAQSIDSFFTIISIKLLTLVVMPMRGKRTLNWL